ncbi:disease resistance protein RUN1-like isoform X2 [Eucalyptus grandis]|uniref:disease resistance protein RUN1-like isoform X2 n=1 Tax=Eucalyptus grandis TaxID=71139 RepID=UPI00192E8911|nr:disease resistance protein RUN1-like isoform X2 [Eucalyptus grandis]
MGIDERVEQITSWIDVKFNDTRIVGIWGNIGVGKTTLARVLYNKLSSHFKHLSFVANIRETSLHKGIECLQRQLIDDILRSPNDVSIDKISVIKSQFMNKKVLVLLDDIDAITDFNALIGDISWVKAGSIVIVTTRNKKFLDEAKVDHKYEVNKLTLNESLILFSRHAFQKDYPIKGYEILSHSIVSIIAGLPLALKVIGSCLYEQSRGVWNNISKKLMEVPHQQVQEMLRICYEELNDMEQQIFLDIACFLIGSSKQSPTYMWDACGFFLRNGIEVLSRMSLIEIDEDDKLRMHDQLRDLGQKIVHLENPKEPQERSKLWKYEEAAYVLDSNKGTCKIEALRFDEYGYKRSYKGEQFKELAHLRYLQVCGGNFAGDFQILLSQLRWLQWERCPSNFEAANFHPKKLVVLNLSWSEISEDWGGWDPLKVVFL